MSLSSKLSDRPDKGEEEARIMEGRKRRYRDGSGYGSRGGGILRKQALRPALRGKTGFPD